MSAIFSCNSLISTTLPLPLHATELLPEEVKSSVARSRCVRMLQTSLGRSIRPSRPICTTTAAIWLEGKVFDALCAAAIQTSNYANTQQASLNSALPVTASKLGSGDTTATTQGAGSAFNRYLANVTRLTFALQVIITTAIFLIRTHYF